MEKSNLKKALELIPDLETLKEQYEFDSRIIYRTLRTIEKAYEQLAEAGQDVSASLRERRFQIAQLALSTLEAVISCDINNILKEREDEGFAKSAGLETYKAEIIECAIVLDTYLRKIYPNVFADSDSNPVEKLFPEP